MKCVYLIVLALLFLAVSSLTVSGQYPDPVDYDYNPVLENPEYLPFSGPVVAVDSTHQNSHTIDSLYWGFKKLLTADGYLVVDFGAPFTDECINSLDDCSYYQELLDIDTLVIACPQTVISEQEAEIITGWLSKELGGCEDCPHRRLILISDHRDLPANITELSARLGLDWPSLNVGARTFTLDPDGDPKEWGILNSTHPIVLGRSEAEKVFSVQTFYGSGFIEATELQGASLLTLLDGAELIYDADTRFPGGGYSQGMAFEFHGGRVYASGEAAMFTAMRAGSMVWGMQTTDLNDNQEYLLNVMHWLDGLLDTDGDGVMDKDDECPGTPAGLVVDAEGCSIEAICGCEMPWANDREHTSCAAEASEVDISMVLEGEKRPDPAGWEMPVTVAFFEPGADALDGTPRYLFESTTTKAGAYAVTQVTGVQAGTYDVAIHSAHSLMNVRRSVVISAPSTALGMGTLLEGDCDDDGAIGVGDYTILSAAYGACEEEADYDARADLDRDGCVGDDDYALLQANWSKASPVELPHEADVHVSMVLEGGARPDPAGWEIPVTVAFFEPGADVLAGTPQYRFESTAASADGRAVTQVAGVRPGTYDVAVRGGHTLLSVKRSLVVSAPSTALDMGTLLEGDCDDDHAIGVGDYGILSAAYDTCDGEPGYDARADLDRDGCVGDDDYALLQANWGKASPIEAPDLEIVVGLQGLLRPEPVGWEVPLSIAFFAPGTSDDDLLAGTGSIYAFGGATRKLGGCAAAQAVTVQPGTYDVTVDTEPALLNVKRGVVISASSTALDIGTLLEGDCDNNHGIGVSDYIVLSIAYGACQGNANYDPRADLDRDGCVGHADYSLLQENWGKESPIEVP